jgi:D-3-phosphoglycerate dehydrogenase
MSTTVPTTMPTTTTPNTPKSQRHVLIADKFSDGGLERVRAFGCRLTYEPDLTAGDLAAAIAEHDPNVLVVRSTKVPTEVFEATTHLGLIIRAGAGYDTIDVAAASAHGVAVATCPGRNALAVAELAWGLILACDRRIPDQTADLRAGAWDKKGYAKARGLAGRTLGIVGLGRIGEAVAARGRAFGMNVVAWSRSLDAEQAAALGYAYASSPIEVARRADVISLHVASTPETKHLVDRAFVDAMPDGAILVNTTRGAVVDEEALAHAVRDKGVRAGLDVYENEPSGDDEPFASPLVGLPGVYGTHHVGASTDQAQESIAAETLRILSMYMHSGEVLNQVNEARSKSHWLLTVRHLNRLGVLAHIFQTISSARINVEEMQNVLFDGKKAACARIQLDREPTAAHLDLLRSGESILSVTLAPVPTDAA